MRAVVSAVSVAAILMVPSTQAQGAGELSVTPATVEPGGELTVSGTGCLTGNTVSILPGTGASDAQALASIPAGDDGSFNGTVSLPAGMDVGGHTITAVCAGQPIGSAGFRVALRDLVPTGGAPAMLTVSRSAVAPGKTVRIFGRPCRNGQPAAMLDRKPVTLAGSKRVGPAFRAEVAIPRGTPTGTHTLSTLCDGVTTASATLRVVSVRSRLPSAVAKPPANRFYLLLGVIAALALLLTVSVTFFSLQRHRTRTETPGYFDLPSPQRPAR